MKLAESYVEVKGKYTTLKTDTVKAAKDAGTAAGTELEKGIEQGVKRGGEKGKSALSGLTDIFKGALFVGGIKEAIGAASDLNETVSKSQVVFGDQAAAIQKFGDTAAKSLGQSKQEAIDAASSFAIFGKSAGLSGQDLTGFATKLTTLAGDMASFSNTSPQDAIIALSAALRGESEPIRQYGVLLDDASLRQEAMRQGLIKTTTTALTPQQRVLAAYQLILNQTKDAQGDFARTADGAANSQRIAAAEAKDAAASFGDNLLPIYTRAVQVVGVLAEGFGALPAPIQLGIVALAGLVAFSGPISTMVELIGQVGPAIGRAFSAALAGLGAVNPAFIALVGVAAAAATALLIFGNQESESDKIARNLNESMRNTAKAFDEQVLSAGTATGTLQSYADKLKDINLQQIQKTITDKQQVDDLNRLGITYQELSKLTGSQADREAELAKLRKQLIDSGEVYIASTNDLTKSANLSASAQQQVIDEYIRTGSVTNGVVEGQKLILQGNTELNGSYNDLAEAAKKNTDQLLEQAGAGDVSAAKVLQARGELDLLTDAQRKNADAALAGAAAQDVAAASTTSTGTAAVSTTKGVAQLSTSYGTLKDQMEKSAKAADEFKQSLDDLMGIHLSLDQAEAKAIEDQQGLAGAFEEVRKKVQDNKGSLDQYTEAGRNNREVIRNSVETETAYIDTLVKSGASYDDVKTKVEQYRENLVNQAVQSGINKDEAQAYIDTLGLTPDNVDTAIKMSGQEAAKAQAEDWIKILENTDGTGIPKEVVSSIKAAVEAGSTEAVGRLQSIIQWLQQHNNTTFTYTVNTVTSRTTANPGDGTPQTASGGYFSGRQIRSIAEDEPEVVLNNQQATKLLWDMANGRGGGGGPGKSVSIVHNWYGDINGVDDLETRLDERDRQLVAALGAV